ncbi:uncharacterized protein LOC110936763 [Helianthus annuus]|uniref:uncharacterized protein LOC110936763 n=1 Tax=Helianthus annuus TaxID=4232 RepID=UPI000B8FD480|nr:uncharacterized protein LOC110936763 [Helianthus annuus]
MTKNTSENKTDNDQPPSHSSENKTLHPAYSVTNIQTKIRILDGTKVTYTSWVKLFKLHTMAYKVLDHIDDTPAPDSADSQYPTWKELDALVCQWIYSTISDDLLTRVLDTDATARTTWLKLEKIFLSNKQAKAAALESRFVNLTLEQCSSVDDYCQQLKSLADQLQDVDQQVTESRLVLKLVRGLSPEFDTTTALINNQKADWDLARSMLHDEVIRQEARTQKTSSVLAAPAAPAATSSATATPPPSDTSQQQPYRGQSYRGRGGRGNGRGRGGRGRGNRPSGPNSNHWAYQPNSYPQWAWWTTPPCPYPTQSQWRPNTAAPPPPPAAHFAGYSQPQYPMGYGPFGPIQHGFDALNPSDLSAAYNTSQLAYTDPSSYFDTGAERTVSNNKGPQDGPPPVAPQ